MLANILGSRILINTAKWTVLIRKMRVWTVPIAKSPKENGLRAVEN
jgi:hypothetical protein